MNPKSKLISLPHKYGHVWISNGEPTCSPKYNVLTVRALYHIYILPMCKDESQSHKIDKWLVRIDTYHASSITKVHLQFWKQMARRKMMQFCPLLIVPTKQKC